MWKGGGGRLMKSTHTSAEFSFVSRSSFSFCSFFICCSSSPLDCKKSKKTVSSTGVMSTVTNTIKVQYVGHVYSDKHNQCTVQGSCPQCQTKSMFSTGAMSTVTNTINVQYRGHVHSDKHNVQYRGCLLYTSPSPRDWSASRMPSSA